MNRRASLPGADELFRTTNDLREQSKEAPPERPAKRRHVPEPGGEASGRVNHDQKITVYLTAQELVDLEQARLRLRAEFDIPVDRGRLVREALAQLLTDLHEEGPDSQVVKNLS